MKVKKIAVIGGGNGAITAAADLTERGFEVTLFELEEYRSRFWLYKEGITEHTIRLLHAIEKERMEIGKALGFTLENATESRYRRGYLDRQDEDLQTLFNESPVFSQIKGPVSVESRYFTEDISEGLVLWSDLGRVSGVATPNIDAVIVLGSTILKTNFYETGLTLRSVGLSGVTKEELLNI